jgi:SAM-dependent methyltransferase
MVFKGATRFKPDAAADFGSFRRAAIDYAQNLKAPDRSGLWQKPLDWSPGHGGYFTAMFQLLNALQALRLTPGSQILEVGSGAGWATEVMAALAYRLTCIEPSSAMIRVARRRVRAHLARHGLRRAFRNVTWRCTTIEECSLPPGRAHAAIYFESFHHVIDEHVALRRTFDALTPGGFLVILGDSNWIPGNPAQEDAWLQEMAAFGTLESPFTDSYLVWLLGEHGFVDITRHHMVDGLVPVSRQDEPINRFLGLDAAYNNLVIARKPGAAPPPDLSRPSTLSRLARRLRRLGRNSSPGDAA